MIKVNLENLDKRCLIKLWGKIYCDNQFAYIPDVVADRYAIEGERISLQEAAELLSRKRIPVLFRKYAIADCKELAISLLF